MEKFIGPLSFWAVDLWKIHNLCYICLGLTVVSTNLADTDLMAVLSDGTVVAQCQKVLTRFNLETGEQMSSTRLQSIPLGIAEVKFRGRSLLVLSYR